MSDYVVQTTIRLDDQASSGARAAADALNKLGDAADAVTTKTSRTGPSFETLNRKLDENAALTAKVSAINRAYQTGLDTLQAALDSGKTSTDNYAEAVRRLGVVRDADTAKAQDNAAKTARMFESQTAALSDAMSAQQLYLQRTDQQTAAITRAASAQDQYNNLLNVKSAADDYSKRAADIEAYGSQLDALRAKYNPLFAVSKQYENELAAIADAQNVGAISAQEAAAAVDRATKAFSDANQPLRGHKENLNGVEVSAGNAAFAQRQFGVQSVQLFSSIATGQPILTSLINQGHQVLDVALSTGTGFGVMGGAIKSALAAIISPLGLAITAVVALGAAIVTVVSHANEMQSANRTLQTAIDGVGQSSSVSASALAEYSKQLAHASELSKTDATALTAKIIRTPGITQDNVKSIEALAPNLGAALGISTPEAANKLTEAYTGNYAAMQKLIVASNDFSLAQISQIRQFVEQGDKAGALKIIMDQLSTSMKDAATNSLSPMQQAFKELAAGWDDFADRVAKSAPVVWVMEQFRKATLGWADILKTDTNAISREIVELSNQALRLQDEIATAAAHGIKDPGSDQKLKDLNARIDALTAQSSEMANNPLLSKPVAEPKVPIRNGGDLYGPVDPQRTSEQGITLDKVTDSIKKQNEVLSASLPLRAAVAAGQKAYDDALSQGLNKKDALLVREQAIALAQRQAGDAAVQEAAAQDRATGYAIKMTDAIHNSSVAALQAAAAEEAHEKAVTQAGVSEAAYTKILLNRNAAQAIQDVAKQTADLKEQNELAQNIADATGMQGRHEAELKNAVIASTKAMVDKAAASQNPGLIAAAQREVDLRTQEVNLQDQKRNNTQAQAAIDAASTEADMQTRIAAAYDGTAQSVTHVLNQEKARATLAANFIVPGMKNYAEAESNLTAQLDRSAKATGDLQQAQASVAALSNVLSSAMDQLGQGIVNAFLSGKGAAVNFGNVVKSVISSIIEQIAKLAIINPIVNSALSLAGASALPTLQSGVQALSGGGSSSGGGFGIGNAISGVGTASSISGAFGGPSIGSALGLTGEGGLLTGIGNYFFGSTGAAATEAQMLTANSIAGAGYTTPGVLGSGGLTGVLNTPIGASFGSSATVGTALTGVGLGFGAGSLLGGLLAGDSPQRHTTATLGAGAGAIAGAAIGSFAGPGGTIIGGLIGGLIGGGGGGLIGPGKKNSFSTEGLSLNSQGQFVLSNGIAQMDENARAEFIQAASDQINLNQFMAANNIRASSLGGTTQLGDNTPGGFADPSKSANFATAFSKFRFSAANDNANPEINTALGNVLNGTSFATANDLTAAVTGVQTFLSTTVPALMLVGKTSGSFNDSIKAVNATFNDSITYAHKLGVEEKALTDARDAQLKVVNDAEQKAMNITNSQLDIQFNTALASINNDTKLANQNALASFDLSASSARDTFIKNLTDTYGDAFLTTQKYTDEVTKLDKTTAEQRLALIAQQNQAAIGATTSTISSLTQFAFGLQTGAGSPLNTPDQYSLASNQFDAIARKAKAGDFTALQQLQGSSNTLLADSQAMFGSGVGFVADFNKVLDVLSSVATQSPDALTASFYAAQTAQATNQVVTALGALQDEVTAVKLAITQSSNQPARLAA